MCFFSIFLNFLNLLFFKYRSCECYLIECFGIRLFVEFIITFDKLKNIYYNVTEIIYE